MSDATPVTLALTRGRILEDCLPLLERAGVVPEEHPSKSRKLVFRTSDPGIRLLVLRGSDVPVRRLPPRCDDSSRSPPRARVRPSARFRTNAPPPAAAATRRIILGAR